ncbi:MAG: SAM-dependent methyltransferase [Planctomycetota bacterium]|jgi:SAM-dependent methyltransferase
MSNDESNSDSFAFDEFFDQDYLEFYAAELNDETNDDEAHTIAELLQLQPGLRILDLPCGHGRIARRLAAMGADVTGIDRSELFLAQARIDADQHGVEVDYQPGDMRTLSVDGEFDVVLNWFTSFGYEDDDTLRTLLTSMHRALVPGGRLLLETINQHQRNLQSHETSHTKELVTDEGTHFLIDRSYYDPHDGRIHARRFITRSGQQTRMIPWQLRLFPLTELKSWLHDAGFANVQAFGPDGEVFRCDSERLIVVAQRQ